MCMNFFLRRVPPVCTSRACISITPTTVMINKLQTINSINALMHFIIGALYSTYCTVKLFADVALSVLMASNAGITPDCYSRMAALRERSVRRRSSTPTCCVWSAARSRPTNKVLHTGSCDITQFI